LRFFVFANISNFYWTAGLAGRAGIWAKKQGEQFARHLAISLYRQNRDHVASASLLHPTRFASLTRIL
jgi:hypothetical protein